MNHRSALVALALLACARSVSAQNNPPEDALTPPEIPDVPPQLARAVASLRETVEQTRECYTAEGRMEHAPDPRCPQWYARIARAGAAGAFAIGEEFRPRPGEGDGAEAEPLRGYESEFERGARLVQLLVATRRPEGATYLVSFLVRTATLAGGYASSTDVAALQGLRTLTGHDPAPAAPWEDDRAWLESQPSREEVARRWSRWLRDHQGMTVAQWRASAVEGALRWLSSDDILERYSAIRRLAPLPAHRAAVTASLHTLLAREDLPAAARVHLTRLARQRGIPLPARVAVAAR